MPIDGCTHDFKALAAEILPKCMCDPRSAMLSPHEASIYLFEVYAALELDCEWNTFRTH